MFAEDIKKLTVENTNFRTVFHTGEHSQIVGMSIPVGGEIGEEVHAENDQILYFVTGVGEAIISGETRTVTENVMVHVPAGATHNFKNTGQTDLKLVTVYSPPEHPDGTIHATKDEADRAEHE